MDRPEVTHFHLDMALKIVREMLWRRVQQHGRGAYASRHEARGLLDEEVYEMLKALQENAPAQEYGAELVDVAVVCVFELASMAARGDVR